MCDTHHLARGTAVDGHRAIRIVRAGCKSAERPNKANKGKRSNYSILG
jgi:hypothetical protein